MCFTGERWCYCSFRQAAPKLGVGLAKRVSAAPARQRVDETYVEGRLANFGQVFAGQRRAGDH